MTRAAWVSAPRRAAQAGSAVLRGLVVVGVSLSLMVGVAWAFWTSGSVPGGSGASAGATVNQGSTPSANAAGRAVMVSWTASTLSNGNAVVGYSVNRYDTATLTLQTMLSACSVIVASTTCTESSVPAGQWVYSVTPVFGSNWRGPESVKSSPVTVAAPSLALSPTRVRPGTSLTGTAAGFLAGDTLRYRLDSPTGTDVTGTLAGSTTPATVPAGGGGAVSVTAPSGTSDGVHTIYAVASPRGESAAAGIVVDGTAPPAPTLTSSPTATSGDAVTFGFTDAEATATVECRLDAAAFGPCDSPVDYTALTAGSHTFQARATDTVGNVGASVSFTWTVNLTIPTVAIGFPTIAGLYNDAGFNAGCGTASTGDVCGTADDDTAVTGVSVSLRRLSTGLWWNGTSFTAAAETWVPATGTTDWTYALPSSALAEGDFTLRAQASDGVNLGYDSRTLTVDRSPPPVPALTKVPPATSGPTATLAFTDPEPAAGFECQLDGGTWTSCSSSKTYVNLAHGSHTVSVRAVDGAGNTSAGASTTWTVDATAPSAAMVFPGATGYNLGGWAAGCGTPTTGDVCGTASDVGTGVAAVAVSIKRASTNSYWDGSAFATASETWLGATGTASWSYAFAGTSFPADGTYAVRWRAVDTVGNTTTGGVALTIDTTAPPAPQLLQTPDNPGGDTAQFAFTDAETGTGYDCRLDSDAWATCSTPVTYRGLSGGSHTFNVRASDATGNLSASTAYTWTVNVGLPNISIGFPSPGGTYNDTTYAAGCSTSGGDVCGTASDPDGNLVGVAVSIRRASTGLYWTGTTFSSPTEVLLVATGTTSWTYAMAATSFPADDSYTLRARATDNVGLTALDTLTITIDRTAPVAPTITSGPTGTTAGTGDAFTFTAETGAGFDCRLDAGTWAGCVSPKTYGTLSGGSHTFDVRAVDNAGNVGAIATRTWTVDATAPSLGTTFPADGTRYTNTTYDAGCVAATGDICGTTADSSSGVGMVEVSVRRASTGLYLTGTTFSAASQTWITASGSTSWSLALAAATFPADDTYTLSVLATDNVGNASTSTTAFVIDRTKPKGIGFTTTNAATVRKLEALDTYTLTYSEAVAPASIIAGWNGTTTQNVVVRATKGSSNKLTVYSANNATLLPLGTVNLKRADYVNAAMTFGLAGSASLSTLTMSGSSVTITLGTPSGTPTVAAAAANASWTPAIGTTDLAGNAAATTIYTETDLDSDF